MRPCVVRISRIVKLTIWLITRAFDFSAEDVAHDIDAGKTAATAIYTRCQMADSKARRMWALPGAQLSAPNSLLVQGGDNTMVDLPCPSFLVEHPKGLVLFDTGCNPKVIDDAVGYWGEIARHLPLKWNKTR